MLAPGSLGSLVEALERSGSDVALGPVSTSRGGLDRPMPWVETLYAGRLSEQTIGSCPDALVGAGLTGMLVRAVAWRASGVSVPDWVSRGVAAAQLLVAARSFEVVPGPGYLAHARDASLPVQDQARFRPTVVAARVGALRRGGRRGGRVGPGGLPALAGADDDPCAAPDCWSTPSVAASAPWT